jgi:hypothetical protein
VSDALVVCAVPTGLGPILLRHPGLTPWAKLFRRSAAAAAEWRIHLRPESTGRMLILPLETVAAFAVEGHGFGYFQEGAGGVREVRAFAVDDAQLAFQL